MEDLLDIDPEALLPEHRALLKYDFEEMGEASPSERQFWIAEPPLRQQIMSALTRNNRSAPVTPTTTLARHEPH